MMKLYKEIGHAMTRNQIGSILIGIGLLDLLIAAIVISQGQSYSSILIFGIPAGIIFIRGNPRWIARVGKFSIVMLGALLTMAVGFLTIFPWGLIVAVFRQPPLPARVFGVLWILFALWVLAWIWRSLGTPDVAALLLKFNFSGRKIFVRSILGTTILLCIFAVSMANSSNRERAHALAQQAHGQNFKYFVEQVKEKGPRGARRYSATVAAWNESELKKVIVEWAE